MLKIKELREDRGLTQKQLGEKINSTNKNIWAYESGIASPNIETLSRLADFFGVTVDYLIGREDDLGNIVISAQEPDLSDDERELIDNYRQLNFTQQETIRISVQALSADHKIKTRS